MNFAFSEEQEAFRDTLRRFLEERSPILEVLRVMETAPGYDPAVWKTMAAELGLPGIAVPEAFGGQGFGALELGIVLEELGRALLPSPYFSTAALAASALLEVAAPAQQAEWLPGIASGETPATLALLDADGGWDPTQTTLRFERRAGELRLSGRKRLVTDAASAALILVVARAPGSAGAAGLCLFAVRRDAEGLRVAPQEPLDATRTLADVELRGVRAELLGEEGSAAPGLARALDRACAALACECAGGAERCLEAAVSHAKQRVQFARPIGSFQAIKHRCAETLLEVESAKSAAYYASWAAAEEPAELEIAASLAKSYCAEAFTRAAADCLHIHGGIGFTWEAPPHLYLKRARANEELLGSPAFHRARIAERKGF